MTLSNKRAVVFLCTLIWHTSFFAMETKRKSSHKKIIYKTLAITSLLTIGSLIYFFKSKSNSNSDSNFITFNNRQLYCPSYESIKPMSQGLARQGSL